MSIEELKRALIREKLTNSSEPRKRASSEAARVASPSNCRRMLKGRREGHIPDTHARWIRNEAHLLGVGGDADGLLVGGGKAGVNGGSEGDRAEDDLENVHVYLQDVVKRGL